MSCPVGNIQVFDVKQQPSEVNLHDVKPERQQNYYCWQFDCLYTPHVTAGNEKIEL